MYRNIQNYQFNKQQLVNDVQLSLDNAIEAYYADLAKDNDFFRIFTADSIGSGRPTISSSSAWMATNGEVDTTHFHSRMDSLLSLSNGRRNITSSSPNLRFTLNNSTVSFNDSLVTIGDSALRAIDPRSISGVQVFSDTANNTSLINRVANSLVISMARVLEMSDLSGYIEDQLIEKGLDLDFALQLTSFGTVADSYNNPEDARFVLSIEPKGTYENEAQKLEMRYADVSLATLRRSIADLIISLLVSITVIGALLYLYRVINQQKQLAEIKNDLISNITHEFKTPIATVSSALEAIANFNAQNDPAKTRKYLDISATQLKKLNLMVEKLLETATLETDALELNRSPLNLSQVLHTLIEKYKMVSPDKSIQFVDHAQDAIIEADAFHLENALSNLIDNAVKYGGDEISVVLAHQKGTVQVVVQDNGGLIEKSQKERVFDKFYRIPKGNQHDVKGFGIGLYYTRKIIEKHGGSIELILSPGQTSFEVAI